MYRAYLKQKGFTLIELLVVIAIIVILAALIIVNITEARMNGRDAKRIADVSSIQLALEMYKDKNGYYPSSPNKTSWAAFDGTTSPKSKWQENWEDLASAAFLQPYLSPLPKDPLSPKKRYYVYFCEVSGKSVGAIIKAPLEADTNKTKMLEDSCGTTIAGEYYDVITGVSPDQICANSSQIDLNLCKVGSPGYEAP